MLVPQQLLACGFLSRLFLAGGGARLGSATEGHVQNQAGECTNTRTIRTFFARSGEHWLVGVVDTFGDQVLCNLLGGFGCALHTTTRQCCGDDAAYRADVGGEDVQQTGRCTQQGGCAALFFGSTFGFGSFAGFTCTGSNTDTGRCDTTCKARRAERKERQGRTQSFTKLTAYSVFVAGCSLKRLLGNTRDLFELGAY